MTPDASALFRKLLFDPMAEEWNEDDLPKLRVAELRLLSQLLGGPKSPPKAELVTRILCTRLIRLEIARFGSTREAAQDLAQSARKERLKWMAKQMKLWRSGSKIQLAIVLINWRDRARLEGQKLLDTLRSVDPGRPVQLLLPI